MSDPHAPASHGSSHGAAVADPGAAGHGSAAGHDDAHGHGAGGGHGHDEAPKRTPVPPFERTPWGAILFGLLVVGAVIALGLVRDWGGHVKSNPASQGPAPGGSATR